jgi:hypothetical protein
MSQVAVGREQAHRPIASGIVVSLVHDDNIPVRPPDLAKQWGAFALLFLKELFVDDVEPGPNLVTPLEGLAPYTRATQFAGSRSAVDAVDFMIIEECTGRVFLREISREAAIRPRRASFLFPLSDERRLAQHQHSLERPALLASIRAELRDERERLIGLTEPDFVCENNSAMTIDDEASECGSNGTLLLLMSLTQREAGNQGVCFG